METFQQVIQIGTAAIALASLVANVVGNDSAFGKVVHVVALNWRALFGGK